MPDRIPFYRRPPVIERVLSVWADMSDEIFESHFEDWRAIVTPEYPVYEPLKQWLISVRETDREGEEGLPLFDPTQPELRITPRFSKKTSKEGFDWSIRCPPGQLTVNMHSSPDQGLTRRYATLRAEFARWLPLWIETFSVKSASKINVAYVNLINRDTVPKFVNEKGELELSQVITVFSIPGKHEHIVPPFDCKVTLQLHGEHSSLLRLTVNDWPDAKLAPAVRLDFAVDVRDPKVGASVEGIMALLDWCHERIIERFEVVFTPKVKQTFDPITQ
jgi:hypothetical protein